MKFSDYTPSQQKAITLSGKNIIVSAGAGSGKTQVLTERVLYFIKNHKYKLNEFLILTFTNLAAGEMKERIRKALQKEGLKEANDCDVADICTFDSYALSLVKKYHYLLNISPNVSIIDSNIIKVRIITTISDIFEEYYKANDNNFIQLISRFCFKDDEDLRKLTLKLYEASCLELNTEEYLNNFIDTYYSEEIINNVLDIYMNKVKVYQNKLNAKLDFLPEVFINKKDKKIYKDIVCNAFNAFSNASTYDDLIYYFPSVYPCKKPSSASEMDKTIIDEFKEIYEEAKELILSLPKTLEAFKNYFTELKPYGEMLIKIVKELHLRIKTYKEKYQVYEFNDIAKLAYRLVLENEEVRNTIKNKLKMIMIDEYQDTSFLQEAFINQIENDNVYMVGDVKQSIYRFRNARCDIFVDKYDKYKNSDDGFAIDLNMNFRSRKEVLDDINYIFKNLMTKEYGGASYLKDHMIEFGNQNYVTIGKTDDSRHSEIIIHNEKGLKVSTLEAHLIARDIIDKINNHYQVLKKDENDNLKLQDATFSDFCILMDRGTAFDEYYKIFSEYQIPLYIDNDENIRDSAIVKFLTNILKLIKAINKKDYSSKEFVKSFIAVARSFAYNYSDDDIYVICKNKDFYNVPFINEIRNNLYQTSSYSFAYQFEQIIFDLGIYQKCIYAGNITKDEKYLDLFLSMFKEMSKLDYSLDDFLIYLENISTYELKINLTSTGSILDSVKIMNIHKSKGLEFNIVYFSGLSKTFNTEELKKEYGLSKQYGLILKPKNKSELNLLKVLNKEYEIKEDISEHIRLFYVALTRAKDKMIFVINNEEYNALYEEHIINISNKFILENNLDHISKKQCFEFVTNSFLNQIINKDIFLYLSKRYILFENFNIEEHSSKELLSFNYEFYLNFYSEKENSIELIEYDNVPNTVIATMNINNIVEIKHFSCKKFYDFITPFINYPIFKKKIIITDIPCNLPNNYDDEIVYENIKVQEVNTNKEIIRKFTPSKTLSTSSSKKNIDLGLTMHLILEILNFKNPNYDFIEDEFMKQLIKEFINSSIMSNVQNANIYKEYEFYDDVDDIHGIIDLMLVYDNHIDIVDYKTKNIDDPSYLKQLKIYKNYIARTFNKNVKLYLYSILSSDIKSIE